MKKEKFLELLTIDVNDYIEQKNNLKYLSWTYAWTEFCKVYPEAKYEIKKFEGDKPYLFDENLGYMVFTSITVDNDTKEMWLPVMDGSNKAMKDKPYKYNKKNFMTGEIEQKTCNAATMIDINKTIMRCLVKNIAMFGLGLYIYSGDDFPPKIEDEEQTN